MAFTVHVTEAVEQYIRNRDQLTVSDQNRILEGTTEELGRSANRFFELNQIPKSQNLFWYNYILMTEALEVREFRFVCSAEGHVYGVIEVLYAEENPEDIE